MELGPPAPHGPGTLDAVVVVPARDEAQRIGQCLQALAEQTVDRGRFEVVLVLDACHDDTEPCAEEAAGRLGLTLVAVEGPGRGTGPARRVGMDWAADRLLAAGRSDGLIATTDADSRPAPQWLSRQLAHVRRGARVIAGRIELDPTEAAALPAEVLARRRREAGARMRLVRRTDPDAAHHHFAGASLGITAAVYRAVGGIEPRPDLEDAAFAERLALHHVPITRPADVVVTTSARTGGRATRGLSTDLTVSRWLATRRYDACAYGLGELERLHAVSPVSVAVIVPVKECAETIAGVLRHSIDPLASRGLVDEVLVVDAGSEDGSAAIAAAHGARVLQQDALAAELGPALGKGDAMWRALQACDGEIVCFLDGDTANPSPAHLAGVLGPLLADATLMMVRGAFDRPLDTGRQRLAHEGGRVTELTARPLINLHAPLLAGFAQPLAGEFAARRELLEQLAFPVGYGVEIATLIDAERLYGLGALAECRLGTRQNRHQPLRALGEMAYAVLAAVERRSDARDTAAWPSGRFLQPWRDADPFTTVPIGERPPIRERLRDERRDPIDTGGSR